MRREPVLAAGPVALAAEPAGRPRRPRRRGGLRPGVIASLTLHAAFAALVVLAVLTRPRPSEPLPPPSYAVYYQSGAPERPAEPDLPPPPPDSVPGPPVPPQVAPPPTPPPLPRLQDLAQPLAPPAPQQPAEATAPPPPPPQMTEALPLPPPPPPAPRQDRQQQAAVTAPPPVRPAPEQRLPGVWLPEAGRLTPPPRPEGQRRTLDLALNSLSTTGRNSPEPQVAVRGAEVGPDWRNAFRRWLDENVRYPANAAVVGEEGTNRIQLIVSPDGQVRSWRLLRRSGSVWLDAGLEMPFRNAVLPAFPPGADPNGVEVNLTVHWTLIRR